MEMGAHGKMKLAYGGYGYMSLDAQLGRRDHYQLFQYEAMTGTLRPHQGPLLEDLRKHWETNGMCPTKGSRHQHTHHHHPHQPVLRGHPLALRAVNEMKQCVLQTRELASKVVSEFLQRMSDSLGGMRDILGGLSDCMEGLSDCVVGLRESLWGVGESLGGLGDCVDGLSECLGGLSECLGGLSKCVGGLSEFVGHLSKLAMAQLPDVRLVRRQAWRSRRKLTAQGAVAGGDRTFPAQPHLRQDCTSTGRIGLINTNSISPKNEASRDGSSNEDRSGDGASTTEESMLGPDLLAPPETEQAVSPNPTTPSQQKPESYQLRHNNHMTLVLESLAQDEAFMDVTLTAQGRSIRAHKSVLSAVSPYFRGVLCENPCQHPIIIMPRDVRFDELQSIITYIYKGEMTVAAEDLSSLLKTAEILQVTGLTPADPQAAAAAAAASFNPQFSGSSDTPRTSKPRTYLYAQPKSQDTINPTDFMDMDMTCVKEEVMSGDEDGDEDEQDSASYPSQNIPHSKGNEPHHTSITQTSSTSSMTTATPSTQTRHTSDANVNPDPCTSPIKEDDEDLSSCQNPMSKEDPDPFVCPHCKEISRGYEALTLHLKVKHPSKLSFPCFCGRVYLRHARYVDHTKCCISQAPGSS